MKKLNKRKIRWIVQQVKKRELGLYTIAKLQDITPQHVCKTYRRYKNCKDTVLNTCGRKPREITEEERNLVVNTYKELRVGAVMIEQKLRQDGINISHNKIHRILLNEKLTRQDKKKQKKRSWVRYERRHSLSLVHSDWFKFRRQNVLLMIDDASRFITHCRVYDKATTKNTCIGFRESLRFGLMKQFMSDHGTQYVSNERKNSDVNDSSFTQMINGYNVRHIKARIKHPQSNGKAERAVGTIKRLWRELGSLAEAVKLYNYKRPHMSLTNGHLRTPYQAFLDKKRKDL